MSADLLVPLSKLRSPAQQKAMSTRSCTVATEDTGDLDYIYPIFAPNDILEVMRNLLNSNYILPGKESLGRMIRLPISCPDISSMRADMMELIDFGHPHMSFSPHQSSTHKQQTCIHRYRDHLAHKVMETGFVPTVVEFAKHGVPQHVRGCIWQEILGVRISGQHYVRYAGLRRSVIHHELLADRLMVKDVHLSVANDPQYFVFAERVHEVLLCLLRDARLLQTLRWITPCPARARPPQKSATCDPNITTSLSSGTPESDYPSNKRLSRAEESMHVKMLWASASNPRTSCDKLSDDEEEARGVYEDISADCVAYPPCGIVPFHGISMYLAPLCYLFSDNVKLLFTFERLYTRHLVHLHTLNCCQDGLLALSALFENLLSYHEPLIWAHLRHSRVQPLSLAFGWLARAFSGYLPVTQLFQLWDIMLAYKSSRVLALLAAAIFSYRRENLLICYNHQTMEAALSDLSSVRVVPLLCTVLGAGAI